MKGYIITYTVKDSYNLTYINNLLFGRVVKVSRKGNEFYYYYPGLLHDTKYLKLSRGCYFLFSSNILTNYEELQIIKSELDIQEKLLQTPREYFLKKYNNIEVINL